MSIYRPFRFYGAPSVVETDGPPADGTVLMRFAQDESITDRPDLVQSPLKSNFVPRHSAGLAAQIVPSAR